MSIYKTRKNILQIKKHGKLRKNNNLSLEDMIGRYKAIAPINSVELKHALK